MLQLKSALKKSRAIEVVVHILFWIGIFSLLNSKLFDLTWGPLSKENNTLAIPLFNGMAVNVLLFYLNAYWLIPEKLQKKEYRSFLAWTVLMVFILTTEEMIFDVLYFEYIQISDPVESGKPSTSVDSYAKVIDISLYIGTSFIINTLFWALAFLYRLPKDWIRNERQKQQLIQAKLSAELDFLKAQINPHFLFNGINSIYHLIGTDDESAKEVLLKFSDLMRYQLYECNEDYILLAKELNYIQNYLSIERIRKGEDAIINVDLPNSENLANGHSAKIAPLLLSPFLENAFKYLSLHSEKEKNRVQVRMDVANGHMHFMVNNTITPSKIQGKYASTSGIGLENVKRRLELIYPERHQLIIKEENLHFVVDLKINLS